MVAVKNLNKTQVRCGAQIDNVLPLSILFYPVYGWFEIVEHDPNSGFWSIRWHHLPHYNPYVLPKEDLEEGKIIKTRMQVDGLAGQPCMFLFVKNCNTLMTLRQPNGVTIFELPDLFQGKSMFPIGAWSPESGQVVVEQNPSELAVFSRYPANVEFPAWWREDDLGIAPFPFADRSSSRLRNWLIRNILGTYTKELNKFTVAAVALCVFFFMYSMPSPLIFKLAWLVPLPFLLMPVKKYFYTTKEAQALVSRIMHDCIDYGILELMLLASGSAVKPLNTRNAVV